MSAKVKSTQPWGHAESVKTNCASRYIGAVITITPLLFCFTSNLLCLLIIIPENFKLIKRQNMLLIILKRNGKICLKFRKKITFSFFLYFIF